MLSRNIQHIVRVPTDCYIRKIQRLRIDIAIHYLRKEKAKLRGVYIRGIQDGFIEVLPRPRDVVVLRGYTNLRMHRQGNSRHQSPGCQRSPYAIAWSGHFPISILQIRHA